MRFGYMPSFKTDLLDEIDFSEKYFDFIEITLKRDLTQYREVQSVDLFENWKFCFGSFGPF